MKAVRSHLQYFNQGIIAGDREAVAVARMEIQKATKRLNSKAGWDKALRWLAYATVPAGIADAFLSGAPIVGTTISVIGAAGAARARHSEKKNEWVLFGTSSLAFDRAAREPKPGVGP
jgi:hypothetical protein